MRKFGRIALVVSLVMCSANLVHANTEKDTVTPVLKPEYQHTAASKRISAQFTREHFKKININDELSSEVFDYYIKHLDYNRNLFLASDIASFEKYRYSFDTAIRFGKLSIAYDIYNVYVQRRVERFEYSLTLLEQPFDFTKNDNYQFNREDESWPVNLTELHALWRSKVKYDVLSLTLADKEWPKIQETLTKRYNYSIKRFNQDESEDVFQLLMNSFARVVEPHTSYLSPKNAEKFRMEMNLSLEGIGAVLRTEDDYTVIQSIVKGGPAEKSKQLKSKDRIVGVAQNKEEFVDIVGWRLDDVVDLIKGPKGTTVRLQIKSGESDSDANIKIVSIVRDQIKLEDRAAKSEVYIDTLPNGEERKLGVIEIPSFYNHLSRDVKKEISKLKEQKVEGMIIDLRGNGGGSLTEATLLTGLFIDQGPVVQVLNQQKRVEVQRDVDGLVYYSGPLSVMVDRNSASASEIFSAALQDYGRAVIIGEHTFGKGTVQQHRSLRKIYDVFEKPVGSIQFTIAKFYRINGGSTQHRGVIPDIAFPTAIDPADWGESREENALPWDQIPKAQYSVLNDLQNDILFLDGKHQARIKNNVEFSYIESDIARYQEQKDDKTISLNLIERKSDRKERNDRQLLRTNARLAAIGEKPVESLDDDLPEQLTELDPFLTEAANITFDLVNLSKSKIN